MQKTRIEYVDYSWNPIRGICPIGCDYCYARRIYQRFKLNSEIRFDEKEFMAMDRIKKPSRIFVGSTIDMYHPQTSIWVKKIIEKTKDFPLHIFLTLTKLPHSLLKFQFPKNWWIGSTVITAHDLQETINVFNKIDNKNIKFISIEPLLYDVFTEALCDEFFKMSNGNLNWIIIGGLTPHPAHRKEWIDRIIKSAKSNRKHKIPVFIKANAKYQKIWEFPDVL